MRAVTENRDLAAVSGLANRRVDRLTFFIGSGLAGIAGVAISLIGAVGFQIGLSYIIDAFLVVIVGGLGKLRGAVIAAFALGPRQLVHRVLDEREHRQGDRVRPRHRVPAVPPERHRVVPPAGADDMTEVFPATTPAETVPEAQGRARRRCRTSAARGATRGSGGPCSSPSSALVAAVADDPRRPDAHPAVGGVPLLRRPRRRHRHRLGLRRHARARPGAVLRPRRLRDGHAPLAGAGRARASCRASCRCTATRPSCRSCGSRSRTSGSASCWPCSSRCCSPALFGWLVFSRRVRGPYFALLTQAMALDLHADHGRPAEDVRRHQRPDRLPDRVRAQQVRARRRTRSSTSSPPACCVVVFLVGRHLVRSRYGRLLRRRPRPRGPGPLPRLQPGRRQDVRASSSPPAMAGAAGAVAAPVIGIVAPNQFGTLPSILMVCWVAVGGRGTLYGADHRRHPRQLGRARRSASSGPTRGSTSRASCSSSSWRSSPAASSASSR